MALRLIEMVLREEEGEEIRTFLQKHTVLEHKQIQLPDDQILVRILVNSENSEPVLDSLEKRYTNGDGNRLVVLPVEATLPRADPDSTDTPEQNPAEKKSPERIGREELYEDIKSGAVLSRAYLGMAALSTIVAAIGLREDNVAVLIGAMVIAPLLGPNMALSLGTALGDLALLRHAFFTALAGIATVLGLAIVFGVLMSVDPTLPQVALRTQVGVGEIAVALASGCAGALAFTSAVSATLIGVMVAVALLPPLVTSGLLLGGGHMTLATGALALFLTNLVCINLAGVTTFFVQGIHPVAWLEKNRAMKATRIAITLWVLLLAVLLGLILLLQPTVN